MNEQPEPKADRNKKITLTIIATLFFWAIILAAGSLFNNENSDWRKPLIVLGTIGTFAAIWLVALFLRASNSSS